MKTCSAKITSFFSSFRDDLQINTWSLDIEMVPAVSQLRFALEKSCFTGVKDMRLSPHSFLCYFLHARDIRQELAPQTQTQPKLVDLTSCSLRKDITQPEHFAEFDSWRVK